MQPTPSQRQILSLTRWTAAILISMAWTMVIAFAASNLRQRDAVMVMIGGVVAAVATFGISAWSDQVRWRAPVSALAELTRFLRKHRHAGEALVAPAPELAELTREIAALSRPTRFRTSIVRPVPALSTDRATPEPTPGAGARQ